MSFILDALRKSETDRQRRTGPGMVQIPAATLGKDSRGWGPLLVALLGINAFVLAGIFFWPKGDDVTAVNTTAVAPAPAIAKPVSNAEADKVKEASIPASSPPLVNREIRSLSAEVSAPPLSTTENNEPEYAATAPVSQQQEAVGQPELYPTLTELRANGSIALPDLHVDIHVYSENPIERFVFINMRKYREGDTLKEGPVVYTITRDGVVFNHYGTLFLLPHE